MEGKVRCRPEGRVEDCRIMSPSHTSLLTFVKNDLRRLEVDSLYVMVPW